MTNHELDIIKKFHGHLGPNVIYGYRMGIIAKPEHYKGARVKVYCGSVPPLSCMIDGIQLSSGCTMGKGSIEIAGSGELKALFAYADGRTAEISVKSEIIERFADGLTHDNEDERSEEAFALSDEEMFDISRSF